MPPQECLRLNDDEGLFPAANYLGQQDQEYTIRPGTGRPFHLSPQDDQRFCNRAFSAISSDLLLARSVSVKSSSEVVSGLVQATKW